MQLANVAPVAKRRIRSIQEEHRKFQEKWTDRYFFVPHDGTSSLKGQIKGQQKMMDRSSNVATYEIAWILARNKKAFTDAEIVKECFLASAKILYTDFTNKEAILKQMKGLQLSDSTIPRCIEDTGEAIGKQLITDISEFVTFHCIIHQEALVTKLKDCDLQNVMQQVVRVVNFIIARALNHRQFRELLEEYRTQYGDLIIHNEVRWLSRGRVFERFLSLLHQIREFVASKGREEPELDDPQWILKLAFLTDITCHLNTVNLQLQGKAKTLGKMLRVVTASQNKITTLFIPET
ncbi:GT2D2 protein, partial [Amia calva]|nr:GT2D2 protein [Amia calva]